MPPRMPIVFMGFGCEDMVAGGFGGVGGELLGAQCLWRSGMGEVARRSINGLLLASWVCGLRDEIATVTQKW